MWLLWRCFILLTLAYNVAGGKDCDSNVRYTDLSADVIIGGIFPAHIYDNSISGYVLNMHAVTWIEAMKYAVAQINKDGDLLPGLKLGFDIRDDCNSGEVGTRHAMDFVLDTRYLTASKSSALGSSGGVSRLTLNCTCIGDRTSKLAAVIGAASSSVSSYVSDVLGVDYIPQISYSSTSDMLSDKTRYRSFLRTLPSDLHQAQAIASLLQYFNWTYASALASDTDYGRRGLDALRENIKARSMCLAVDQTFNPILNKNEMDELMNLLRSNYGISNVVVLWCEVSEAITIIKEANKRGMTNITWIATETWSTHQRVIQELAVGRLAQGIMGVRLEEPFINGFWLYLSQLTAYNYRSNPWMNAAWKGYGYGCTEQMIIDGDQECDDPYYSGLLFPLNKYPFVISAVYAFAHGLHKELGCSTTACPSFGAAYDYQSLFRNILNSSFDLPDSVTGSSNRHRVEFDEKGEIAFRSYTFASVDLDGKYSKFPSFGTWIAETQTMDIKEDLIKWKIPGYRPRAVCGLTCHPGQYVIAGSSPCCWQCASCPEDKISTSPNQRSCVVCSETQVSNKERTSCLNLAESRLSIKSTAGILICIFSFAGVFLTLVALFVFICHWDTPVIRSSSREMSCIQLFSILILFCMPVLFVIPCTPFVCAFRTVVFGTSFGNVVAFIVVKTYRLLRVFQERFTKVSKFLQTKYQVFFSFVLVMIELAMCLVWFAVHNPHTKVMVMRDAMQYFRHCGNMEDGLLFILLCYIFILALASAFMAYRARKLPENFNEAQFISFAMFASCLVWIAFVPLFFSLGVEARPIVFMTVNLASSYSLLFILYGFKVRIILFYPKLNSQEHFRRVAANATVQNFIKDKGDPNDGSRPRVQSVVTFDFNMSRFSTRSMPHSHSFVDGGTAVVRVHRDGTRVSLNSNGTPNALSPSLDGKRSASISEGLQLASSGTPFNPDVRDSGAIVSPPGIRSEKPKRPPTELDVLLDMPLDAMHELSTSGLITSPKARMHPRSHSMSGSSSGDTASSKTSFSTTPSSSRELPVEPSGSSERESSPLTRLTGYSVPSEDEEWNKLKPRGTMPYDAVVLRNEDERHLLWDEPAASNYQSFSRERLYVTAASPSDNRMSTASKSTVVSDVIGESFT